MKSRASLLSVFNPCGYPKARKLRGIGVVLGFALAVTGCSPAEVLVQEDGAGMSSSAQDPSAAPASSDAVDEASQSSGLVVTDPESTAWSIPGSVFAIHDEDPERIVIYYYDAQGDFKIETVNSDTGEEEVLRDDFELNRAQFSTEVTSSSGLGVAAIGVSGLLPSDEGSGADIIIISEVTGEHTVRHIPYDVHFGVFNPLVDREYRNIEFRGEDLLIHADDGMLVDYRLVDDKLVEQWVLVDREGFGFGDRTVVAGNVQCNEMPPNCYAGGNVQIVYLDSQEVVSLPSEGADGDEGYIVDGESDRVFFVSAAKNDYTSESGGLVVSQVFPEGEAGAVDVGLTSDPIGLGVIGDKVIEITNEFFIAYSSDTGEESWRIAIREEGSDPGPGWRGENLWGVFSDRLLLRTEAKLMSVEMSTGEVLASAPPPAAWMTVNEEGFRRCGDARLVASDDSQVILQCGNIVVSVDAESLESNWTLDLGEGCADDDCGTALRIGNRIGIANKDGLRVLA